MKISNQKSNLKKYFLFLTVCFMLLAINFVSAQVRPIGDIRRNDSSGTPLLLDSIVTFTGLVSAGNQFGSYGPAFVFDNTGGVAIYDSIANRLAIGDSITVTGRVTLYSGLAEISNCTFTRHATGRPVNPVLMTLPEIPMIDTAAGYVENEGTFIRVNYVRFTGTGVFAGETNYTIQDSLGRTGTVRIDNNCSGIIGQTIPSDYFNLFGVVSQYDNSAPYLSGYQVMPRSIADLQLQVATIPIASAIIDADSNGIPDLRGSNVTVTGVVTAPTGVYSDIYTDIYVQDFSAGVNVFSFSYTPLSLGDSVIVTGQVYFYRGKTEINNASIAVVGNNAHVPDPIPITCAMMNREPYEGMLVKLTGVFSSAFLLAGDQNYVLVDESGSCIMRIDIDCEIPGLVVVQDTFTVIGVKSQYTSDTMPPVHSGYQFMPRFRNDFSRSLNSSLPLLTIDEVQRPGADGVTSAYEGQYVKVNGWITGPSYIFTSGSSKSLYIQDATNGANVYAPTYDAATASWLDSCGTYWECIGKVTEYNGLTEIANGVMTLLDTNRTQITPRVLPFNTAVTEGMESRLIEVTGPVITEPGAAGGGSNFTIKNGTPGITIRVMDAAGIQTSWVKKNKRVKIVGIVGQYSSSIPPNSGYQVMPRFAYELVDLTDSTSASEAMRIDTIYPNPFSPTDVDPLKQATLIKLNSPADYRLYLEIFDLEGRKVKSLLTNQPGGYYELYWDGTDEHYESCPIGIYILNLKGITAEGKDVFVRKPIVIAVKH